MRAWGLAKSAFWAGVLLHLGTGSCAPISIAAEEPSALRSSSETKVRDEASGSGAGARANADYDFQVWSRFLNSGGSFYSSVIRGQEPDMVPEPQEPPSATFTTEEFHGTDIGHENCGCHAHGLYPTAAIKRAPVSLFEMDSAQPVSVFRFRFDSAYDLEKPDRAEYYWAKIGDRGPKEVERSVDYQDVNFYSETALAEGALGIFTEVPIRVLEPSVNDNTTGLGDIIVGLKTVMLEEDDCLFTFIMKTYIPSGVPRRGLGTGHTSLEPGILGRYQLDEVSWLHGEFKFWFPLGGDPDHSGEVLRWGIGASRVLCEWNPQSISCYKGLIGTLEFVGWAVVDGRETEPNGKVHSVDPAGILNVQPGFRYLCGKSKEIGVSAALSLTNDHWYDELIRIEFRKFF